MFAIDAIRQSIETVASQAINACEPETVEQGIDNLKGLMALIESSLSFHDPDSELNNAIKAKKELFR